MSSRRRFLADTARIVAVGAAAAGTIGCEMEPKKPPLFWVWGQKSLNFQNRLDRAVAEARNKK